MNSSRLYNCFVFCAIDQNKRPRETILLSCNGLDKTNVQMSDTHPRCGKCKPLYIEGRQNLKSR